MIITTYRDCLLRARVLNYFYSFSSPGELSKKSLLWLQLHSKKVKTPLAISVWPVNLVSKETVKLERTNLIFAKKGFLLFLLYLKARRRTELQF